MSNKYFARASFFLVAFLFLFNSFSFAGAQAVDYLCELGTTFYNLGKYDDALAEFNKALTVDPTNETAKHYVNKIFKDSSPSDSAPVEYATTQDLQSDSHASRDQVMDATLGAMNKTLAKLSKTEEKPPLTEKEALDNEIPSGGAEGVKAGPITISGEVQARVGATPDDFYWKNANWDMNEKNWRMLSNDALNRRENTYDARVYDRLRVNLDSNNYFKEEDPNGLGFHSNITVDPWSYTGKSAKTTVSSAFGDTAQVQVKYMGNTQYTLNQTVMSSSFGNSFSLPEMKLYGGKVYATNVGGAFTPADTFYLPEMDLDFQFQPLREFWIDYNKDDKVSMRFYPMAYENQAQTFDDPLRLSNNRTWWEDSPWIRKWTPGIRNSGLTPIDFNKGYWDKTISFGVRDSEGQRLTALRGAFINLNPTESTSFYTSIASPKDPWQDYNQPDNVLTANRLKQKIGDSAILGFTATNRVGFDVDDNYKFDANNYVLGTDLTLELFNGLATQFEYSHSESQYDLSDSQFKSEYGGNAYYVSLLGRFPLKSILNEKYGYDGINRDKEEGNFTKFRLFAARMDDSFDQPLSSYMETRDDEWWGRHLHFRTPFSHYYQGQGETLTWDDVKNFKIGTGIDVGRSTLGARVESSLFDNRVDNLFDVRNVHNSDNGKFIENVARDEVSWRVTDKFTTKALGIYHKLHKTLGGQDPFTIDPTTGVPYVNNQVEDGVSPSLKTGSLGAEYAFFDWLALNGIWEYTNDYYLGYDGFPRTIFNGGSNSYTYWQNGNQYRSTLPYLYNQQYFPAPPYKFYNIFKTGLRFNPFEQMEIYLDYTRNEYEKAGQVSDNMNHVGLEIGYRPMPKLSLFFKYNYSRWQDLDDVAVGVEKVTGHHNFFTELIYRISQDEDFSFQYGEASRDPYMGEVLDVGWDPYGGALRTIDTQHIFRLYYRRRF